MNARGVKGQAGLGWKYMFVFVLVGLSYSPIWPIITLTFITCYVWHMELKLYSKVSFVTAQNNTVCVLPFLKYW